MTAKSVFGESFALRYLVVALTLLFVPSCYAGNELDGLYLRTAFAFRQLNNDLIYIKGNQIAWNPKGGVDPFDFTAAAKTSPKNIGTFKIVGDQMEVTWGGDVGLRKLKIEYQNGKMSALDGGLISKVGAYKDDEKLDATFAGVLTAGGAKGVTAGRAITFQKDGKFSMDLGATAELNPKVVGGKGAVQSAHAGTYKLSGNTLTLTFSDGKTETHTVCPYSTATDPKAAKLEDEKLFYDTMMLSREK